MRNILTITWKALITSRGLLGIFFTTLMSVALFTAKAEARLQYIVEKAEDLKIIIVSGQIEYEDRPELLRLAIMSNKPDFVSFDSPGGNPFVAMELGRILRQTKTNTIQIRRLECASACAFAFMGGVNRIAEAGSIGVHKNSFSSEYKGDAAADIQELTAELISYFNEMGVDPALLQIAYRYSGDDIRYLSSAEMMQFGVTTPTPQNSQSQLQGNGNLPTTPKEVGLNFTIPNITSGTIRHPKGSVFLMSEPTDNSIAIVTLTNGAKLQIIRPVNNWLYVSIGTYVGYIHKTWLKPDQFELPNNDMKFTQIASFKDYHSAVDYVRNIQIPTEVYYTSDSWFAVTAYGQTEDKLAKERLKYLKSQNVIPADSFVTYGNTYIRQLCCN